MPAIFALAVLPPFRRPPALPASDSRPDSQPDREAGVAARAASWTRRARARALAWAAAGVAPTRDPAVIAGLLGLRARRRLPGRPDRGHRLRGHLTGEGGRCARSTDHPYGSKKRRIVDLRRPPRTAGRGVGTPGLKGRRSHVSQVDPCVCSGNVPWPRLGAIKLGTFGPSTFSVMEGPWLSRGEAFTQGGSRD
jgi:hypothetical protein